MREFGEILYTVDDTAATRVVKQSFNADTDHQAGSSNLAYTAVDLLSESPEGHEGGRVRREARAQPQTAYEVELTLHPERYPE